MNKADKDAAIQAKQEAIIAVIYALGYDPEDGNPYSVGTASAHAAFQALESAGFTVERRAHA